MAMGISATDISIVRAHKAGLLRLDTFRSHRTGEDYVAIRDEMGLIEVAADMAEAEARINSLVK